jgi:hypothetical protein
MPGTLILLLALGQIPDSITLPAGATERHAVQALAMATGWDAEVVMPDDSRADLVGPDLAVEVEWATKWKESIGQAVLYGIWSGKRPAVVLLADGDQRVEVLRCRLVCERVGVVLYVVRVRR